MFNDDNVKSCKSESESQSITDTLGFLERKYGQKCASSYYLSLGLCIQSSILAARRIFLGTQKQALSHVIFLIIALTLWVTIFFRIISLQQSYLRLVIFSVFLNPLASNTPTEKC